MTATDRDNESFSGGGIRARLFDADRTDRILSFDDAVSARVSSRQLLWIDLGGELEVGDLDRLVERFGLPIGIGRSLSEPGTAPEIELHGKHFYIRVATEPDAKHPERVNWLGIVAGPNVVLTRHVKPLDLLDGMNKRIAADAAIGTLDSAEFVAALLESIITSYHAAIDGIEDELDDLDTRTLGVSDRREPFNSLVDVRRRVGRLRRLLAAHRELFDSLGRPDFGRGIKSADPGVFEPLRSRFENVLVSVETTREVVLASFDVLMTRTAQRTNDVMRVLTLVTVLGLPATIIGGLMGMNLFLPLPEDDPGSFWVAVGIVLLFEVALIGIARLRRWI